MYQTSRTKEYISATKISSFTLYQTGRTKEYIPGTNKAPCTLYQTGRTKEYIPGTNKAPCTLYETGRTKEYIPGTNKAPCSLYQTGRTKEYIPGTNKAPCSLYHTGYAPLNTTLSFVSVPQITAVHTKCLVEGEVEPGTNIAMFTLQSNAVPPNTNRNTYIYNCMYFKIVLQIYFVKKNLGIPDLYSLLEKCHMLDPNN